MRITRIEGVQVSVPLRAPILTCYGSLAAYPRTIVHVHTDEGLVGLGEVSAAVSPATLAALGRAVEGFDPWQISRIRTRLENWGYYVRHERAIAAIEIALLDLLGKAVDKPVHEIIGGALRDRVPAAASPPSGRRRRSSTGPRRSSARTASGTSSSRAAC